MPLIAQCVELASLRDVLKQSQQAQQRQAREAAMLLEVVDGATADALSAKDAELAQARLQATALLEDLKVSSFPPVTQLGHQVTLSSVGTFLCSTDLYVVARSSSSEQQNN